MIDLQALLAYQEAEMRLEERETALRTTPSRVKLNQLYHLLKNQKATLAKLNEDITERLSQYERIAQQITKLDDELTLEMSELQSMENDEESTAEEMTELRVNIEKLAKSMNACMREIKSAQQLVEKASADYQAACTTGKKAKQEYDQLRVVCEKEKENSAGEIAALTQEVKRLSERVEPELLKRYQRVKQHNAQPIVTIVNNKCGGCNMSLPTNMLRKLSQEGMVECENCGRILYISQ